MLTKPKYVDPRTVCLRDYVARLVQSAQPHPIQEKVLELLREKRDCDTLRQIAAILPKRPGLSYETFELKARAARRIQAALRKSREFAERPIYDALDIGCARAENIEPLFDAGVSRYIGVDIDDFHFPPASPNVTLVKANAEKIPLEESSADISVSFNVFEHIPSPSEALQEIIRTLRPGGVFYTKFGPPFNAATGPHLTRMIDLPYIHHLFPEEEVAKFTGRVDPYYSVNKLPLSYYRKMFFREAGFRLAYYREQINGAGFWLIKEEPSLSEKRDIEELAIVSITSVLVKL